MNILFLINSFSIGGAEKLAYDLALEMRPNVNAISVVGLYKSGSETENFMRKNLEEKGIKTYVLGKRAGKDRFKSVKQIYKIIKQDKISIIHAHCGVPMLLGKFAGFFARIPVICTIHSTSGYSVLQEKLTSWMSKNYVSIGDAAEKYMLETLKIPSIKITRIYNAVNAKNLGNATKIPDFWAKYGGKTNDINLVHIGRVHQAKNQICYVKITKSCEQGSDFLSSATRFSYKFFLCSGF